MSTPATPPATWRRRFVERLVPVRALYPLRFELHAARVRLRGGKVRDRYDGTGYRVNVGAGAAARPGWINLDISAGPQIVAYDCRRSLPFRDGSVDLIFTEHFLEHLDYETEVPRFLADCYRVLTPGGTIRVVVPDLAAYLRAYFEPDWDAMERLRSMDADHVDRWSRLTFRTKMEVVNFVMRQQPIMPHQYGYDAETLTMLLADAGFSDVREMAYATSRVDGLAIDNPEREPESLYVEAVR